MALSKGLEDVKCFFDIKIDDQEVGRIVFKLFCDVCPKTCENFRQLCTGEAGISKKTEIPLCYKSSVFHRVVKSFIIQGGDIENGDGRGGDSIYDGCFDDENFQLTHDEPYLLSMANKGPNTNKSQFFITTNEAPHLDGKHVVFGRVVSGLDTILCIERQQVDSRSRPLKRIEILHCGQLKPEDTQRTNLLTSISTKNSHNENLKTVKPDTQKSSKLKISSDSSKLLLRRSRSRSRHSDKFHSDSDSNSRRRSSSSSNSNSSSLYSSSASSKSRRSHHSRVPSRYASQSRHESQSLKDRRRSRSRRERTNRRLKSNKPQEQARDIYQLKHESSSISSSRKQEKILNIKKEPSDKSFVEVEDEKEEDEYDSYPSNPHYKCSIKRGEIPEVPVNRFLLREPFIEPKPLVKHASDDEEIMDTDQIDLSKFVDIEDEESVSNERQVDHDTEDQSNNNSTEKQSDIIIRSQVKTLDKVTVSKSGRIMKGRGNFKFKTPSPERNIDRESYDSEKNHTYRNYDRFPKNRRDSRPIYSSDGRDNNRRRNNCHGLRSRSRSKSPRRRTTHFLDR